MKKIILLILIIIVNNAYSQYDINLSKYFKIEGIKQLVEKKYIIDDSTASLVSTQIYEFNDKGLLINVILPVDESFNKITFTYDEKGNKNTEKYYKNDFLSYYSLFEYSNNKLISIQDKGRFDNLLSTKFLKYNSKNKLIQIKDEDNNYVTDYLFVGDNCSKIKMSYPSHTVKVISLNYDINHNITEETCSLNSLDDKNKDNYQNYKKSYKYDERNKLIEIKWVNSGINFEDYKYFYKNDNLVKWERTNEYGKLNFRVVYEIIKNSPSADNNSLEQKLFDAQKAFNEGKYLLVLELLRDFPIDNALYFDAVTLMNKALEYISSNSVQNFVTVSGRITCSCKKPIYGYVIFEDMNTKLYVGRCRITSDGYYCTVLPSGKLYSYYIDSKDFYPLSRSIDFTSQNQSQNYKDNFTLTSYEEMKEQQLSVRINNIFFDFNESILKPESYLELDRLYKYLNDNPEINVEISGHTDNVGTEEYNITLSYARANAVKEYLVSKGINLNRIVSKGYGKSKPVATNETDEGRQLNRRVEFKILK
jgi:outer membrane protein OmpA-like peptidoglycan-associated protein